VSTFFDWFIPSLFSLVCISCGVQLWWKNGFWVWCLFYCKGLDGGETFSWGVEGERA
jgi:hypothetical protein